MIKDNNSAGTLHDKTSPAFSTNRKGSKRRPSETRNLSYNNLSSVQTKKEREIISIELEKKPCQNSRQLSASAGIDRTSITREITGMKDDGLLIVTKDKCPITGKLVEFYSLRDHTHTPQQSELFPQPQQSTYSR